MKNSNSCFFYVTSLDPLWVKKKIERHNDVETTAKWNHYLSGLIDGEGCFSISFTLREKMKHGVEVRPSFSLGQTKNKDNYVLLDKITKTLGCGGIRLSRSDNCYKYETRNLTEITNKVIPFVKRYPLHSSKKKDFDIFAIICSLIAKKSHLHLSGLQEIIELAFSINLNGTRKINKQVLLATMEKKSLHSIKKTSNNQLFFFKK